MAQPTRDPATSPGPTGAPPAPPAHAAPTPKSGVGVARARATQDGFYDNHYIPAGTIFPKRPDERFASWMESPDAPRRRPAHLVPPTPRTRLTAPATSPKTAPEPAADDGEEG